jgi:hypothetical protein
MAAHKEKQRWQQTFAVELSLARVEPWMTFCTIDVVVHWKQHKRRDVENYRHPVIKPLADALVVGHYLDDDTDQCLDVRSFHFAYPETWTMNPLLEGYMKITLGARY